MITALTNGQRWQAQGVVSDKVGNSIRKCNVEMKLESISCDFAGERYCGYIVGSNLSHVGYVHRKQKWLKRGGKLTFLSLLYHCMLKIF